MNDPKTRELGLALRAPWNNGVRFAHTEVLVMSKVKEALGELLERWPLILMGLGQPIKMQGANS